MKAWVCEIQSVQTIDSEKTAHASKTSLIKAKPPEDA